MSTTPVTVTAAPATSHGGYWDADRSGQVLAWAPQGAGDFADLAWAVAQLLGNGPGVRGIDVHRKEGGTDLFAWVSAETPEYVEAAAAAHGLSLCRWQGYANARGSLGNVALNLTWLDPTRTVVAS